MVNDYFDCSELVKRCFRIVDAQARLRQVTLEGPVFETFPHRYYFKNLWSDERRYLQIMINFLTNAIKFTPAGGSVKVLLKVISATEISAEEAKINNSSICSNESAPDKEMINVSKSDNNKNR